uniref:Uncharacterized protein n=1 Tax=Aplanochytrium stocchinoi TaxID=215587 RepID=A0A7S3PF94_9STRA|mmetsp:Transcript_14900/g.18428  ORF Transcript_14900/g.18428 Transcript_14900/m.18428 type:complete len:136 (-) Transcript_14900:92-499(-)
MLNYISSSKSKRGQGLIVSGLHETPGPGAYNSVQGTKKDKDNINNASSMFANRRQDRFGCPYTKRTVTQEVPGPGAYAVPSKILKETPTIKSSFISKTARCKDSKIFKAPGPAYYSPQKVNQKRSFMLNVSQQWV